MMTDKRLQTCNGRRKGTVLLVVLFIVMSITVLSLGFISRSDTELACGNNMILRTQMDYLAESGLEYAKSMILNPYDVSGEYWTGASGLQLVPGSNDYFDVTVSKTDYCNYHITSTAYRLGASAQRIARSAVEADLRIDPCIAWRIGDTWTSDPEVTIYGDFYCKGDYKHRIGFAGDASIHGDTYSKGYTSAYNIDGSEHEYVADDTPVAWPVFLDVDNYKSTYYIGENQYFVNLIDIAEGGEDGILEDISLGPTAGNPAGIYYYSGNLEILNNVIINGTLVVDGDLTVKRTGNTFIAEKNFPAIIVKNKFKIKESANLYAEGLVVVKDKVEVYFGTINAKVVVVGALWVMDHNMDVDSGSYCSLTVTASPDRAAIKRYSSSAVVEKWTMAGGAFFKNIKRQ